MRLRATLAAAAGALALFAFSPTASSALAAGSISGTVEEAANPGTTVDGISVCAFKPGMQFQSCTTSAGGGKYTISNLAPADYLIGFFPGQSANYLPQYYDQVANPGDGKSIELAEGEVVEGIDAKLIEGGQISGQVTKAETSTGIQAVQVCAKEIGGKASTCSYTGPSGNYTISGLNTAEYKVEFWAGGRNYVKQFYEGAADEKSAAPVEVTLGAITPKIDAALQIGSVISGTISNAAGGAPLGDIVVSLFGSSGGEILDTEFSDPSGAYSFIGLPAGEYRVGFSLELGQPGLKDEFESQYYDGGSTFADADVVALTPPAERVDIDASLSKIPGTPPSSVIPIASKSPPPLISTEAIPVTPKHRCRRGTSKKKVRGKARCVKVKKAKKKHRR